MMALEDLTPEEIWRKVKNMDDIEARDYLETLPRKVMLDYNKYVMQKAREVLSYELDEREDCS